MPEREEASPFAFVRNIPGVGTPLGDLLQIDDPAEIDLRNKMRAAAEEYERYRALQSAAQMQGLQQAFSLYEPLNVSLEAMYGPQARFSFGDVFQDPTAGLRTPPPEPQKVEKKKTGGGGGLFGGLGNVGGLVTKE